MVYDNPETVKTIIEERKDKRKRGEAIKSMEEFQKKYFPKSVGVTCPYCVKPLEKSSETKKGER